jgi:hypothetical protein
MNLHIELWDVERVKPYDLNAKKHDEAQVGGIAHSIKTFGWDQPIVVDRNDVIIKGHGRRLAAIKLGMKKVPVLKRADLTDDQANAARLADNRAAVGDFDTEVLRKAMQAVNDLSLLAGTFDEKELNFSTVDMGEQNNGAYISDVDAAVEAQDAETRARVDALAKDRVPLIKAFGFKDVQGADEIYYSRFIALAEAKTGHKGEQAVTSYIKELVGPISQG